jgi:charged multivesicular body protein 5
MAKRKIEDEIELTKRQIAKLELKVNEYRSQLRRMEEGPSKDKVRQEKLPVLKKKKKLEIKLENLGIQLENLCQQQQRVQNSRENKQTVNAMKMGTKALKKLNKRTSKEDVEDVMDKTAAFVEQSDQVQQIFGRLSSLYPECSAEDLEAELDALSDDSEVLEEEGTSLLNNTVIAPDPDSVVAGPPQHINVTERQTLGKLYACSNLY